MSSSEPTKMWSGRFREPLNRTFERCKRRLTQAAPYLDGAVMKNSQGLLLIAMTMPAIGCARPTQTTVFRPPSWLKLAYSGWIYFTVESFDGHRLFSRNETFVYAHFPVGRRVDTELVMTGKAMDGTTIAWSSPRSSKDNEANIVDVEICLGKHARTQIFHNYLELALGSEMAGVRSRVKERC